MIVLDLGGLCAAANGEPVPRYLVLAQRRMHFDGRPTERTYPVVVDCGDSDELLEQYPKAELVHVDDLRERTK